MSDESRAQFEEMLKAGMLREAQTGKGLTTSTVKAEFIPQEGQKDEEITITGGLAIFLHAMKLIKFLAAVAAFVLGMNGSRIAFTLITAIFCMPQNCLGPRDYSQISTSIRYRKWRTLAWSIGFAYLRGAVLMALAYGVGRIGHRLF
jgi:hypothetical protein